MRAKPGLSLLWNGMSVKVSSLPPPLWRIFYPIPKVIQRSYIMKIMPPSIGLRAKFKPRKRGFTLIELLTVIAIIGILAAIIIPTVSKVRSTARRAQCVARLRQWGTAVRLFANDNKGMIAAYNKSGTDQLLYSQYFGQLYMVDGYGNRVMAQVAMAQCPIAVAAKLPTTDPDYRARDYAFVNPIVNAPGSRKKVTAASLGVPPTGDTGNIDVYNLTDALTPSRLILMAEVQAPDNNHFVIDSGATFSSAVRAMQISATSSLVRHGGSSNMLYLDGHVGTIGSAESDFSNPTYKPIITTWLTLK
jgi:prepilin-type N-terminal cleavage/methylation domain-containing protein/prepilin-type processing-associated H-X9-DG protein